MKSIILVFSILLSKIVCSQSVNSAEYFFDLDPGVGNGTSLSVNSSELSQTYNIDVSILSDGFHDFYIRIFNSDNKWSHYDRSTIYIASFNSGQNVVAAEYYFDLDNGVGTGTPLDIDPEAPNISMSYSIPTSNLDEGFHSFYIRTQVADGTWSHYDRQIIYIKDFQLTPSDVVKAEYFIDSDPGIGEGESLNISNFSQVINYDTGNLSEGDHFFCVRVQNLSGEWSFYDCEVFTIDPNLVIEDSLYRTVQVDPNPFNNTINLTVSRSVVFQNISVYDITGKEVYNTTEDLRKLNLENLEAGTYLLNLVTDTEKATYKIIKQ